MALYRKYRPRSLEKIVGNKAVVQMLTNMARKKQFPQAMLFTGPSGCGKTTLARIVSDLLGCAAVDRVEINSSSFRGIDTVRDLASQMQLSPVAGSRRVYICDEVHKWTNDAQNAILKSLEDTPSHVHFLLCTTDPQKLLRTIRTRCSEVKVQALSSGEITTLVRRVCTRENVKLSDRVCEALVDRAAGSPRAALVLLEQLVHLDAKSAEDFLDARDETDPQVIDLCRALIKRDSWAAVAKLLKGLQAEVESVRWAVLMYARSVLLSGGKSSSQAFFVIQAFSSPFYDSKEAGLAAAAYEAIVGDA